MMVPVWRSTCAGSCSNRSSPPTAPAPGSASTSPANCARRTAPCSTTSMPVPAPIFALRGRGYGMAKGERRSSGKTSVLVVDDEADIRELLDLTLLRMGLAVECAGSLAEAYEWLKKQSFDLCLTDMRLPDGE